MSDEVTDSRIRAFMRESHAKMYVEDLPEWVDLLATEALRAMKKEMELGAALKYLAVNANDIGIAHALKALDGGKEAR